jgi:hypothetical protein
MKKSIEKLLQARKQALHNASRQRRQEDAGVDVRVTSSFWEQVARDYRREIEQNSPGYFHNQFVKGIRN